MNQPVTAEEFVKAWQSGKSLEEVGEKLGIKPSTAASRACEYRKRGVQLKRFQDRSGSLDVAALNRLISASPCSAGDA
jgi:hypothetical protein